MSASDVIMITIILFTLGIGMFVIKYATDVSVDKLVNNTVINSSSSAVSTFNQMKNTTARLDYVFFGVFIGLALALIITGWFIGGNPIFMFIYFIIVMIAVVCSAVFANVWVAVTNASIFGVTILSFPKTNLILSSLPLYTAIIGFIGITVMFAKPYVSGGE